MLSILRVLDQHRTHPEGNVTNLGSTINRNEFKIIYVWVDLSFDDEKHA